MAITTPNVFCCREEACVYIQAWLIMEGISVHWNDIVGEFDTLRKYYQKYPRKHFRIPMFEVECIFKRLAYRYGK